MEEEPLFVDDVVDLTGPNPEPKGATGGSFLRNEVSHKESSKSEDNSNSPGYGRDQTNSGSDNELFEETHPGVVDRIKLASLLKDFDAENDPLFRDVPGFISQIVKEMLENDFLLVLGKGLGIPLVMKIFLAKVKQVAANALVLVLGQRNEDETGEDQISFGVTSAKRSRLYNAGGVYHITGPIAVVDILTGVLDCSYVSGLILAHGENVREDSTTAFVIKLLKQRNEWAFIKAMSDEPEKLVLPPALPLKLRVLGVPTLMLWPRFHLAIDRSLPKLSVDEIIVEQNIAVRRQQVLLTELMQVVISDIKRRVPHLDVDFLAPELDTQQNPDRLHATMTVDTLLASNDLPQRVRSALSPVWHQLSYDGRNSVISLSTLQQLLNTLTVLDAKTFYTQLEFARKDTDQPWTDLPAVHALVGEARRSAALRRMPGKFYHVRDLLRQIDSGESVLILCTSLKTVVDLHAYLSRPEEMNDADEQALKDLEREMREKDEEIERAKAAEAAAKVNEGRPGRRRVRGGSQTAASQIKREPSSDALPPSSTQESIKQAGSVSGKREFDEIDLTEEPSTEDSVGDDDKVTSIFGDIKVTIATYRGKEPLEELSPTQVIMYDPNLLFTREVEMYVASQLKMKGESRLQIHFMYYQQSAEELQYLTAMRREKDAFSRLIREKGLMPMHIQDGEPAGGADPSVPSLLMSSRRKYDVSKTPPRIVVDVREFRSALPFHIWQARVDVIPLTLLVGDYILTPDIVVERKSISDLISSFRDGRLYQQCEAMLKYYKTACILLEFDNKSFFTMEPFKDLRTRTADVRREIQENLCTLMLRFPKVRLLWSSSPMHSAQIFQGLKEFEPEPDPDECTKAGQSMLMDSAALSMLEIMPGLSPRTAPLIAQKVSNMKELVSMSKEDISKIIGVQNGEILWRFINNER